MPGTLAVQPGDYHLKTSMGGAVYIKSEDQQAACSVLVLRLGAPDSAFSDYHL